MPATTFTRTHRKEKAQERERERGYREKMPCYSIAESHRSFRTKKC